MTTGRDAESVWRGWGYHGEKICRGRKFDMIVLPLPMHLAPCNLCGSGQQHKELASQNRVAAHHLSASDDFLSQYLHHAPPLVSIAARRSQGGTTDGKAGALPIPIPSTNPNTVGSARSGALRQPPRPAQKEAAKRANSSANPPGGPPPPPLPPAIRAHRAVPQPWRELAWRGRGVPRGPKIGCWPWARGERSHASCVLGIARRVCATHCDGAR